MECTNPTGCTLESSEMVDRISAWREVAAHAIRRDVDGGRMTSIYPKDPELQSRLHDLIAAEALCCAFLEFTLREAQDHVIVELSFPPEARPLLELVIAPPLQAGRSES